MVILFTALITLVMSFLLYAAILKSNKDGEIAELKNKLFDTERDYSEKLENMERRYLNIQSEWNSIIREKNIDIDCLEGTIKRFSNGFMQWVMQHKPLGDYVPLNDLYDDYMRFIGAGGYLLVKTEFGKALMFIGGKRQKRKINGENVVLYKVV